MTFKEIADTVLAASPADQTEVVYRRRDESLTRFANNHIHQNVSETNHDILVRCVSGSRVGIAVSNVTHADKLGNLARMAFDLARRQPENPEFKGLPVPSPIVPAPGFDSEASRCTPAARAKGAGVVCRKAAESGYTAAGSMTTGATAFGVANSEGVFAECETTLVDASTVVMSATSSGWAQASGWKLDSVMWEQLAEEAVRKTKLGENPQVCEPGDYTVILDPYATADLLAMMAMDGMSARAVQEERSWMNGRIGEKILSPMITIVDDALDPAGIPLPFDFEGQPKKRVAIVDDGVCRGPVYDSYTAGRQAGAVSTGHATEPSATERIGPLPMNLFLRPGTSNVDEMIASTRRGLYITRFWYTRTVHPRDVVVTGMTRDGTFMVRDGEIAGAVKSMRFTQSYIEALSGTVVVGGPCKTLWSAFTYNVPPIKLDRFKFTSSTR
jgi:predicted Zn-dependent protease